MAELEARLGLLEKSMAEEMEKDFQERQMLRMRFLDKEREVYQFALSQLQWVAGDA